MNTLGFVGNNMGFAPLIWFDKLTMSGFLCPLTLSLSKGMSGPFTPLIWFDKLTMSGAAGRTMILTIIPLILSLSKEMSRGNQSG